MKLYQDREYLQNAYNELGSCKKEKLWVLEYQSRDLISKTNKYFYEDARIYLERKRKRFQTDSLNVLSPSDRGVINMVNSVEA